MIIHCKITPGLGIPCSWKTVTLGHDQDHNNTEEAALAQAIIFSNET